MVYIVAALAILHFVMAPGSGGGLPFLMVGVYAWLMAWRVLERFRLGTRAPVLFGLALVAALFTAGFEAVWLALSHGYPALETLRFNFSLELGPSAAWRVLALGLLVAGAAAALGQGGRPSPARR